MLDNVKFNRNHFQQRTKFVNGNGGLSWLTLPIDRKTRSEEIKNVQISSEFTFKKWQRPILESYQTTLYFDQIWPRIADIISDGVPSFQDIAESTLGYTLETLSGGPWVSVPKMIRCSMLEASTFRTTRLIDICRAENISHLVMGEYALESHEIEVLDHAGISLMRQRFTGPDAAKPIPGVMGIHYMMEYGPSTFAEQLNRHWCLIEL